MTAKKTLFTPVHAPVDLAMLAPCRETHKSYLDGSIPTSCDTWLVSNKGRANEWWTGETRFRIEGCARVPAQILSAQGETCKSSVVLDLSHTGRALQAEENVVCNLECSVAYSDSCRHLVSKTGVLKSSLAYRLFAWFASLVQRYARTNNKVCS